MKYLIVNADDFGLDENINNGIIEAYQKGILSSTSLMCSAPAFTHAVELAKRNGGLGVGVHLTLVGGVAPVLPRDKVSTLVDAAGKFYPDYGVFLKKYLAGKISRQEIEEELRSQIKAAVEAGIPITHIDSHQHLHIFPGIVDIVIRLAREFNIKAVRVPNESILASYGYPTSLGRFVGKAGLTVLSELAKIKFQNAGMVMPDRFFGMLSGGNLQVAQVINYLGSYAHGCGEIMTHPGNNDAALKQLFTWGYRWEQERDTFINPRVKSLVEKEKIKMINFGGLIHE